MQAKEKNHLCARGKIAFLIHGFINLVHRIGRFRHNLGRATRPRPDPTTAVAIILNPTIILFLFLGRVPCIIASLRVLLVTGTIIR